MNQLYAGHSEGKKEDKSFLSQVAEDKNHDDEEDEEDKDEEDKDADEDDDEGYDNKVGAGC